jgi:hypothetical protein
VLEDELALIDEGQRLSIAVSMRFPSIVSRRQRANVLKPVTAMPIVIMSPAIVRT